MPMSASSVPAIGVHKPTSRSIPTQLMKTSNIASPTGGCPRNEVKASETKARPEANRSRRRPTPGEPLANVEKSRRTTRTNYLAHTRAATPKRSRRIILSGSLELYDSALQSDHGRVGTVFGAQFRKDISHLTFHSIVADR